MENITTTTTPATNTTRNALKAILIIILFFSTFLISTTAFVLKRFSPSHQDANLLKKFFSLISCFGAGVFLATCLLDLLPDSIEYIQRAEKHIGHQIPFPLAAFCIATGFLLVLFMEQTVIYANKRGWIVNTLHTPPSDILEHSHDGESAEYEQEHISQPETEMHSTFCVLLLVFALSLHAVFEGLSIGMISDVPILLQVFISLLIHKTVVGFSLGVRLIQTKLRPTTIVICCAIFAGQILIGGFSGLAIMDLLSGKPSVFLVSGILQAIACGTFLYVTTFEILPHEFNNDLYIPQKILCITSGFALITIFIAVFPDSNVD